MAKIIMTMVQQTHTPLIISSIHVYTILITLQQLAATS